MRGDKFEGDHDNIIAGPWNGRLRPRQSPSDRRRLFAQNFDGLRQKLQDRPIIGHARNSAKHSSELTRTRSAAPSLRKMQSEVTALADAMQSTNGQTNVFWTEFKDKFDQVDTALGRAVGTLSKSTADQSQLLSAQVRLSRLRELDQRISPVIPSWY